MCTYIYIDLDIYVYIYIYIDLQVVVDVVGIFNGSMLFFERDSTIHGS